jgi:hypothetical protein
VQTTLTAHTASLADLEETLAIETAARRAESITPASDLVRSLEAALEDEVEARRASMDAVMRVLVPFRRGVLRELAGKAAWGDVVQLVVAADSRALSRVSQRLGGAVGQVEAVVAGQPVARTASQLQHSLPGGGVSGSAGFGHQRGQEHQEHQRASALAEPPRPRPIIPQSEGEGPEIATHMLDLGELRESPGHVQFEQAILAGSGHPYGHPDGGNLCVATTDANLDAVQSAIRGGRPRSAGKRPPGALQGRTVAAPPDLTLARDLQQRHNQRFANGPSQQVLATGNHVDGALDLQRAQPSPSSMMMEQPQQAPMRSPTPPSSRTTSGGAFAAAPPSPKNSTATATAGTRTTANANNNNVRRGLKFTPTVAEERAHRQLAVGASPTIPPLDRTPRPRVASPARSAGAGRRGVPPRSPSAASAHTTLLPRVVNPND